MKGVREGGGIGSNKYWMFVDIQIYSCLKSVPLLAFLLTRVNNYPHLLLSCLNLFVCYWQPKEPDFTLSVELSGGLSKSTWSSLVYFTRISFLKEHSQLRIRSPQIEEVVYFCSCVCYEYSVSHLKLLALSNSHYYLFTPLYVY